MSNSKQDQRGPKQRKRGNAEGSIYHMQDGRWRAVISLGNKPDGTRNRKVFTASTRHEVAEDLTKALRDQQRGININPEKQTVGAFLTRWLETVKCDVAPATYISYEAVVRLHLTPALGKIPLAKLGAHHVQKLKQEKLDAIMEAGPGIRKPVEGQPAPAPRHLSGATVRYCLVVLRMALDQACKLDLIPRNVAALVDFPKVEHAEIEPYSPGQAQQLIEAAKGHRLGALFSVALAIGLRKGEALALKWPAIDFERGTLAVRLALQRVKMPGEKKGQLILKEPKRSSRRTINLPQVCVSALLQHRVMQSQERRLAGSRWKEAEYVFTTGIGTPLEPRNLERAYKQILATAGLHHIRIHDLRHRADSPVMPTCLRLVPYSPLFYAELRASWLVEVGIIRVVFSELALKPIKEKTNVGRVFGAVRRRQTTAKQSAGSAPLAVCSIPGGGRLCRCDDQGKTVVT